MKTGTVTTYLTDRMGALLDEHGPSPDGNRVLAEKLGYIVPGWDAILRDEKARWRERLTREEWFVCQAATLSHAFSMETGGLVHDDASGAVLACVEDTQDSDLEMADAARWRASTIDKLRGATVAAQLALVWMLIRERGRKAG